MTNQIHKGDIGTKFRVTIANNGTAIDISTCTVKEIIFQDPYGVYKTKTATFETDGSDGMIYWTTTNVEDLDKVGKWKIQAKITMSGTWHTEWETFDVFSNIDG
jgi:hypothetical protein